MTEAISRLHITPLNPSLLPAVLGVAASKFATNISYHSLQTFPEHGYGYVDLPTMEAEKVKKKINGAILKGKKIKVEDARPKKRKYIEETVDDQQQEGGEEEETNSRVSTKERKRDKRDKNVVTGHELSPEREVKRGWTETKSEQSRKKKEKSGSRTKLQATSKFTDKKELLFRTKVPKNKSSSVQNDMTKKKRTQGDAQVVHEFEKSTTMPSFLRDDAPSTQKAMAYEDDKGWVDQNGSVIEGEERRVSKRRKAARRGIEEEVILGQPQKKPDAKGVALKESTSDIKDKGLSSAESHNADVRNSDDDEGTSSSESDVDTDETSSSGSSASDSEEGDAESSSNEETATPTKNTRSPPFVHPLEALFKKPIKPASFQVAANSQDAIKPSLEIQTTFSFFDTNDDSLPPIPMTPFSSQDLRSRELRSAAPTPDTAHPSRMSSIFNGEDSDDDELSEMEDHDIQKMSTLKGQRLSSENESLQLPQTDFEKQFWEKRGENNRAWKARRRAVLKEKRQRKNRARRPKNW